jgi:hypothetical protein
VERWFVARSLPPIRHARLPRNRYACKLELHGRSVESLGTGQRSKSTRKLVVRKLASRKLASRHWLLGNWPLEPVRRWSRRTVGKAATMAALTAPTSRWSQSQSCCSCSAAAAVEVLTARRCLRWRGRREISWQPTEGGAAQIDRARRLAAACRDSPPVAARRVCVSNPSCPRLPQLAVARRKRPRGRTMRQCQRRHCCGVRA